MKHAEFRHHSITIRNKNCKLNVMPTGLCEDYIDIANKMFAGIRGRTTHGDTDA